MYNGTVTLSSYLFVIFWEFVPTAIRCGPVTIDVPVEASTRAVRLERTIGEMKLEVLHIDACPNWEEAGRRLQAALAATGHGDVEVGYRLLRTPADATATAFAGSPTITVDGVDLFPSDGRTNDLACRVYLTPAGLAGLPTVDQLTEALST